MKTSWFGNRAVYAWVAVTALCGLGCGGEGPASDEVVDPQDVSFAHLQGGFWVQTPEIGTQRVFQFLRADEVRALYGGVALRGRQPIDDDLASFGERDAMIVEFIGADVSGLIATRVQDGEVGFSELTPFGFMAPRDRPITRFVGRELLVIDDEEYRWHPDCHWFDHHWAAHSLVPEDMSRLMWVTGSFTRAGEFLVTGNEGGVIAQRNACPVRTAINFDMDAPRDTFPRPQLHPYRDNGLIGFYTTVSDLIVTRYVPGDEPAITSHPTLSTTEVTQVRIADNDRYHLLLAFPSLQSTSGEVVSGRVTVDASGAEVRVEQRPLPELPERHTLRQMRLLPDGNAFAVTLVSLDVRTTERRAVLVERDGAWIDLDLVGSRDDGPDIDLADFDLNPLIAADSEGDDITLYARVTLSDVTAGHARQRGVDGIDAILTLHDRRVSVHPLLALPDAINATLDVDPEGSALLISEDPLGEMLLTRLREGRFSTERTAAKSTTGRVTYARRYYGDPTTAGTPYLTIRHNSYTPGVGTVITNGWASAWLTTESKSPPTRSWSVTLLNAPAGASVQVVETGERCEDTCVFEGVEGQHLGLRFTTPAGWIVDGPEHCRLDHLDAGYCSVYVDPDIDADALRLEFRYARTPALAANETNHVLLQPSVRSDGALSVIALASSDAPLPDGTHAPNATTQAPANILCHFTQERFDWAWYDDTLEVLAHAPVATGITAVVRNSSVSTQTIAGETLAVGGYARVVFDTQGSVTRASVIDASGLTPEFRVLDGGHIAVAGRAAANSVLGNVAAGAFVGLHAVDNWSGHWFEATPSAPASLMHDAGNGGVIALVNAGTTLRKFIALDAAGDVQTERDVSWLVGTAAVDLRSMRIGPSDNSDGGMVFAFQASQNATLDSTTVTVSGPSIVTAHLSNDGAVSAPVVFAQTSIVAGQEAIRSVTQLGGQRIVLASAGSLTDETFYIEGQEPFTVGTRASGGTLDGFTSSGLYSVGDDSLLWITRGWSGSHRLRPFSTTGGLVLRLSSTDLALLPNAYVRSDR